MPVPSSCVLALSLIAQAAPPQKIPDEEVPRVGLGKGVVVVATSDGTYGMHLWFRAQIRYSDPFDDAPICRGSLSKSRARPSSRIFASAFSGISVSDSLS